MTQENEYEIPQAEPGLEEIRKEPDIEKNKKPPLPPEKIQEIIDSIEEEEKEEREHEKKVNDITKKIRPR